MDERTDSQLLDAWRRGDLDAGSVLFERHFGIVQRFFATKASDAVAEDLIQSTFAACVTARDRIDEPEHFRAYLLGIARYELIAHYKLARRRSGAADDGELSALRDGGASPSACAAEREEHRALLDALRSLPLDQQVVLELHYWEDLSTDEIARVMGTPLGTVKSRLRLARDALKARLQEIGSTAVAEGSERNLDTWARELGSATRQGR